MSGARVSDSVTSGERATTVKRAARGPEAAPGRRIVLLVTLSAVAGTLPVFLVGALAVQIRADLHFGPSLQGLLASLYNGTVAIAALPLAGFADRLGWWRSIRLAAATLALCLLGIAAFAHQWALLAVFLVIGASAHAIGMPSGNVAILRGVAPQRRGSAFGIRQAAIPLSMLIGGLSVPLVAVRIGWRPAFVVAAILPFGVLIALRGMRASPSAGPRSVADGVRPPLTLPLVMLLALSCMGAFIVNTASAFLVTTAVASGVSDSGAGGLLILGSAAALAVRVGSGLYVDRGTGRGYGVISGLVGVGMVGFLLVATGSTAAIVVGTVLGFGAGTGWPGVMHYVTTSEYPDHAGGVSGLILATGNVGGFVGPLCFGIIAEHIGYGAGWLLLACAAFVAIACTLTGRRLFAVRRRTNAEIVNAVT